jgi:putative transposase
VADRRSCYPLTLTDAASRYLLSCEALSSNKAGDSAVELKLAR